MPGLGMIISTRLDPELSEEFTRMVDERGLERSALLRELIREWVLQEKAKEVADVVD